MVILVVSGCFPPAWSWGGQVRSIWNMCRGLAMAGANVRVVTTDADLEGRARVRRKRVEEGIPITTVPVWGRRRWVNRYAFAPGLVPAIWRATRKADLCVLQGVWTFPLAAGSRVCQVRRVPYVVIPRGTLEKISLSEKAAKKRLYTRLVESGTLAHARAVQFTSEGEKVNSRDAVGRTPAFVHPNPVEFQELTAPRRDALRNRVGVAPESILVGISGRLHPRKGFEVIVPALARCPERVHLVSFGADEAGFRETVVRLAESFGVGGRVHFLGQLDGEALQSAYASVDLVVLSSLGESFGNTALEALAQGTTVMVSDRVPLGDYLIENDLGTVVRPLKPAAWGEALTRWVERPPTFDRARASSRVREDFGLKETGERLLAKYERLVGNTNAPTLDRGTEFIP